MKYKLEHILSIIFVAGLIYVLGNLLWFSLTNDPNADIIKTCQEHGGAVKTTKHVSDSGQYWEKKECIFK